MTAEKATWSGRTTRQVLWCSNTFLRPFDARSQVYSLTLDFGSLVSIEAFEQDDSFQLLVSRIWPKKVAAAQQL